MWRFALLCVLAGSHLSEQAKHVLVKSEFEFKYSYVMGLEKEEQRQLGFVKEDEEEHSVHLVPVKGHPVSVIDKLSAHGYKVVAMTSLPNHVYDERILWTLVKE